MIHESTWVFFVEKLLTIRNLRSLVNSVKFLPKYVVSEPLCIQGETIAGSGPNS
jgi:hypothetical protein